MTEQNHTLAELNAPSSRGAREGSRDEPVKTPKGFEPRFASREKARQVAKQITVDHREIIEALAK